MSRNAFISLASAALIAMGGGAYAQSEGGDADTTTMPERGAASPGMPGARGEKMTMPSQDLVGKQLVNAQGDAVGDIEAIEGDSLIVGVGGFLGLGERRVQVPWSQVQLQGAGDDAKVQTSMTRAQLKALPEYKGSATMGRPGGGSSGGDEGGGGSRSGAGEGAGGGSEGGGGE